MNNATTFQDTSYSERFNAWRIEHLSQRQFILLLSFFVGIFTALAALVLKWLIHEVEFLLTNSFDVTKAHWLFLLYPVIGIYITALFIKYVVRDDIGHGVTKILFAISRRQGNIKKHNCWSSIIASGITIGFGGSVGAESPIVLTGSAIGSTFGRLFNLDHKTLMLLIGCGASGAVAGIFKAPIAGLVFTLEVLMVDLTMASLLPLLVSCVTAAGLTYFFTGVDSIFVFHLDNAFSVERIPTSILLGVFCGLVSLYFTRTMNAIEDVFRRYNNLHTKLLIGGVTLSVLIYLFPPLYGEGYNVISMLLNGTSIDDWQKVMNNSMFYGNNNLLLVFLALILLLKVFASSATNGGGGCGGIFAPCLFLGCIGGFIFSRLWNQYNLLGIYVPEKNYALLGMAGVMSGVMHAPLTSIFLIAELTGGYDLFLPLMIVSVCSYLTIITFEPHSIYSMRLAKKGQLLTHHKDRSILTLMSLDTVIEKYYPRIRPDMELGRFVLLLSKEKYDVFPVVDGDGILMGIINLANIRKVIFRQELYSYFKAEQLMEQPATLLYTNDPMTEVMDKFQETGTTILPVLDNEQKFVGFISKEKLYSNYRQLLVDFSEE
ncbi:MAG: chloride channel protein [Bacteroidaceae bacterium]